MVFENQHPQRKAQNMAALLALVILIGVILPIPIGAGFGDWLNSTNAPTNIDLKYKEIATFSVTGDALLDITGYRPVFVWWNDSSDGQQNKHNASMTASVLSATHKSNVDSEWQYYNNTDTADNGPEWDNGVPYWDVYFNYTAKAAYADNVIQLGIKMTAANALVSAGTADKTEVVDGKALLSAPKAGDDKEPVTIELTAGGVTFFTDTLAVTGDGKIDTNITITTEALRMAIIGGGDESYFHLKITGHDVRPIDMSGSAMYCYNTGKLFGRDDGLYVTTMISIICAALGIFLVQPKYNLPLGTGRGQGRGRRF
jgi:hypothetical protein